MTTALPTIGQASTSRKILIKWNETTDLYMGKLL